MSDCGSKVGSGPESEWQEMRMCLNHTELHDFTMWSWLFPHIHKRNLKALEPHCS